MFTSHVNFGFENMLKRPDAAQILLDAMSKDKAHLARFVLDALDGKIVDARAEGARTPLISAVFLPDARSRSKFMDLLLRRGAGVDRRDAQGRTALSHACERGHLDAVEVLVRNNADPERADAWGNTSLMYAAAAGHVPVVEFLVRAFKRLGLQIDRQNKVGNSAAKVAHITDALSLLKDDNATLFYSRDFLKY
uniref:Ankyrin repeat domain-containing protein n=1 Tax=Denticeps clupeoides TaxID=299321 RepID=A0AAY4BY16_9TELE